MCSRLDAALTTLSGDPLGCYALHGAITSSLWLFIISVPVLLVTFGLTHSDVFVAGAARHNFLALMHNTITTFNIMWTSDISLEKS